MTNTVQSRSLACLNETDEEQTTDKPEEEDNISLLLSVCGSLNDLYKKLSRLNYVMQKK